MDTYGYVPVGRAIRTRVGSPGGSRNQKRQSGEYRGTSTTPYSVLSTPYALGLEAGNMHPSIPPSIHSISVLLCSVAYIYSVRVHLQSLTCRWPGMPSGPSRFATDMLSKPTSRCLGLPRRVREDTAPRCDVETRPVRNLCLRGGKEGVREYWHPLFDTSYAWGAGPQLL